MSDQAGTSGVAEEVDSDIIEDNSQVESPQQSLQQFWCKVTEDISKVNADDFKSQALPLARIKKIMKLDEEVKMISAEAPRNDIAMAISKCDQFDFLIDIVPRQEVKPNKPRYDHAPRSSHIDQVAHHQAALQNAAQPQIVLQPCAQIQLTQAQLNMIRLQVQNNPNQPIIIQAQSQQSPQIIQVSSQGQHQPQQQVFLAQVATSQDDS
ncbi:hypothetical protein HF086_008540 [Spodoptera exigua]|uniref:Transcription factor CBF/NF-Y/archaeal histone domain-containing protein n=1 Tax=Spodoptera exigua TaxID=7107 RepID=A0A922M3B4_SPOEX|nr:hypothetical protein HF086_008540 [Spodoptera exigua]